MTKWTLLWGRNAEAGVQTQWVWTAATAGVYAVIVLLPGQFGEVADGAVYLTWLYAAGYAVFGGLLLGAVARWWRDGSPALWRPLMLGMGLIAALFEIWMQSRSDQVSLPVDLWMVALLGLLTPALLARLLPIWIIRPWLGLDRRQHDTNA